MCDFNEYKNKCFVKINIYLISFLCILHYFSGSSIKETDYENIYDAMYSSPLFDFFISNNCGANEYITFHIWEGRKKTTYYIYKNKLHSKTRKVDTSDIIKINGNFFCYRYISYKELLYNGQIIKNNEECKNDYPKDCGIIDTLKQHLCIKENEKCPLYDVGIGIQNDLEHYIYNEGYSNVYYNNEKYNEANKKIIGKLMLNDGQPCYRIDEKLWRKFMYSEVGDFHLECQLEIFDKITDDRYENKGDITYLKLYEDNLPKNTQNLLKKEIKDEKVSLYKREFLGIDKLCNDKYNLLPESNEELNSPQKMAKSCLTVEGILMFVFLVLMYILIILRINGHFQFNKQRDFEYCMTILLLLCMLLIFICIIIQYVALKRMEKLDLTYDCSDDITNEILNKEKENTYNAISSTTTNLVFDIIVLLFNFFTFTVSWCADNYGQDELIFIKF